MANAGPQRNIIWRLLDLLDKFFCFGGMHCWDYPGGHCESCGKCDEFLGRHDETDHREAKR